MQAIEKWALVLLSIFILGMAFLGGCESEKRSEAAKVVHVAVDSEKVLVRVEKVEDTIFVHDTVRLAKFLTKWKEHFDTVNIHDTVQVKEYIQVTDSTIKACSVVVTDCDRRHSNDSLQIVQLNTIIKEQPKEQSSVLGKIGTTVLHIAIGVAGGYLIGHAVK